MKYCPDDQCTSCMACADVCPFKAIEIYSDKLHVLKTKINDNLCRNCGLCSKVCPVLNPVKSFLPQKAYALYSKNQDDRTMCSSGGVASTLYRYVLNQGGVVYGTTILGGYPRYIRITDEKDVDLLKGSKYVYCDPLGIYRQVENDLKESQICLFIGIPCNVAALRGYLRREYDTLYCVDIVCHGTPPYSYLHQHLSNKIDSSVDISNITFRGKRDFFLTVYGSKSEILYNKYMNEDAYYHAFEEELLAKDVCYRCSYANEKRMGDITIGDFWGVSKSALNGYKGKVSVALINSSKGMGLFDNTCHLFIYEERPIDEAIQGNSQLKYPIHKSKLRTRFESDIESGIDFNTAMINIGIANMVRGNALKNFLLKIPRIVVKLITQ